MALDHLSQLASLAWYWLCLSACLVRGCQKSSSGELHMRLVRYENPANILINGISCDSGSSQCDPAFEVAVHWSGAEVRLSTECFQNMDLIDYSRREAASLSPTDSKQAAALPPVCWAASPPSWAVVRVTVKDCTFGELQDTIGEFQLNLTSSAWASLISNESAAEVFEMWPIRQTPESIRLAISVWAQCSPGFYGDRCDRRCEPTENCCCDSLGELHCGNSTGCVSPPAISKPVEMLRTTTPGVGAKINGNGGASQASIMFAAVMASSLTSILFLAIIALVAIRMCKASESNAAIIHHLAAAKDGASAESLQTQRYQYLQQQSGFFNLASYNTIATTNSALSQPVTIVITNAESNGADSGVYEDLPEPPAAMTTLEPTPPPLPTRRQIDDMQRTAQSKSYSRKANN